MATPIKVQAILAKAFPGVRFTSAERSQEEQDELVAAGKTKARNSQHVSRTGLDMVLPEGASGDAVRAVLASHGINLSEVINESGKGKNQGTGAHLHIGWGEKGGAKRQEAAPVPDRIVQAVLDGSIAPDDEARLRRAITAGELQLPEGVTLPPPDGRAAKTGATLIPQRVIEKYNARSDMTEGERNLIDRDLSEGLLALPGGAKLQRPPPRNPAEYVGIAGREAWKGVAAVPDFLAAAVNGPINVISELATGKPLLPTGQVSATVDQVMDTAGVAKAETPGEKLFGALVGGGAGGGTAAGMGLAMRGVKGATGALGRGLSAAPAVDVVSGAAGGGAAEAAAQNGAGPLAQTLIGVAAGTPAGVSVVGLERAATKFGPKAAKIASEVPRAVVFDEKGALTEEGRELATRREVKAAEVRGAYDEIEAANTADQSVARAVGDGMPDGVRTEEPPTASPAPEPMPANESAPAPSSALARVEEAKSLGVDLTRGQALQDPTIQAAERDAAGGGGPEGRAVAEHFEKQKAQTISALENWDAAISDPNLTKTERGEIVQQAVQQMRDAGKDGVAALYAKAREVTQQFAGEAGDNLIRLDTAPLLKTIREVLIDEGVDESVRKALRQQAVQYEMMGGAPKTFEDGSVVVKLRAADGSDGPSVPLSRAPEPLTVLNAEKFRQFLNSQWDKDTTGALTPLKSAVDDAVEDTLVRAVNEAPSKEVGQAWKDARAGFREQKQTFEGGDVVQKIADWKRGDASAKLSGEEVIDAVLKGGPEGYTNVKRLKAVLLAKGTPESRGVWSAVQGYVTGDIIRRATTTTGEVTAAGLQRAIAAYGETKLKTILGDESFNQLMKIRRVVNNQKAMPNTVNSSGTTYALARMANQAMMRLMPALRLTGVGQLVDGGAALVRHGSELVKAKEAARGATSFTAEEAAKEGAKAAKPKGDPAAFLREFVEIAGSPRPIGALLGATAVAEGQEPQTKTREF